MNGTGHRFMPFEAGAPGSEGVVPLCVPEIRGNEWKYIKECLDTKWVSSVGPFVDRFEAMVADYVGAKYAIATVNGTAALHIALLVAGIQPDDEILVSTLTFIAPANAIRYVGARPVFIDAEPDYWQMDPQKVVDFLEHECRWVNGQLRNRRTNRRVRAILPVDILGHPVDMDPILEITRKYNLALIEDASESLGAKYKGRRVGHLTDLGCYSFNGNKIITSGGGGMIVTDNEAWASKARYLTTQAKDDPLEFIHGEIGYNYRLTNIQAAMGCAQLEQIERYIDAKRRIGARYTQTFKNIPGIAPMREAPWAFSIYWMFTVLIHASQYGVNSRTVLGKLSDAQIESRPLWQPLHRNPVYRHCQAYHCDIAEQVYQDALSLPCSVGLTLKDQERVIELLCESYECRSRSREGSLGA